MRRGVPFHAAVSRMSGHENSSAPMSVSLHVTPAFAFGLHVQSVLKSKKGAAVDSHDLVGRFNYFRTAGFEEDVGSRCDLWFLGELKVLLCVYASIHLPTNSCQTTVQVVVGISLTVRVL
jgi:hypothetical protein